MKRKAFGLLSIFLVMLQLFSPWMINLSEQGISVEKNVANAATRDKVLKNNTQDNTDAFIIVTGLEDQKSISVSLFTDPNYKITSLNKIEFISDEKNDRETGCQADTITLVSNPSLTSPIKSSFAGVGVDNTAARGYLKQDFKFTIPNTFTAKCLEDNSGMDAWGHYKFTYTVINRDDQTPKTKSEETTTGDSVEFFADTIGSVPKYIKEHIVYITAQKDAGNSFAAEWGQIRATDFTSSEMTGSLMTGSLEVEGNKTKTLYGDVAKQTKSSFKINFLQNNSDITLYKASRNDTVDSSNIPPKSNGVYQLKTDWGRAPAEMAFDPNVVGGSQVTWTLLNSSTKQKIEDVFTSADYVMNYSIKELTQANIDGDTTKPVIDIDVSMIINKKESKVFVPWNDKDGNRKASAGDIAGEDWENFTREIGSPEIDRRPASEGNGFYLLYSDTNDNPEVGDSDVKEINLNEYIFGEKVDSPIITRGLTGMTFGLVPLAVTEAEVASGKKYYFRLYANENDPGIDDYGYTTVKSLTLKSGITQTSRGAAAVLEDGNAAEADDTWLPPCEGLQASTWFQGCLVRGFYYLVYQPTSALLSVAGTVLDFVLAYSIQPDAYKATYIVDGWRFIRDACNLFFIFMMIYLAFKMIMGIGHGTKQAIVNTIIIATVINFSYPLTTVIIDASNITARQLYYNVFKKTDDDGKAVSLSSAAAKGFSPQKIVMEGLESNGKDTGDASNSKGSIFMILLVGVAFNIIAMVMFIKISLQFIYRIVGLIFAIILSPLAVFSFSLSEEQRGKLKVAGFDNWLSGLLSDAFKAPVFLFLVMILLLFVNDNPFHALFGDNLSTLEWWASLIVPFMLIIAFFKIISSVTADMTSALAKMAGGAIVGTIQKVGAFGLGAGAAVVTGGAALAGRSTIGKWAAKKAEGMRNSDGTLIKDTWINRQRLKAFDKTAKGSFDLRQTAAGNAISKSTGLNMDNKLVGMIPGMSAAATAGGYMAMQDRKRSRAVERGKLWQHNKKLEEELEHRKEALEGEMKGSESERDGVKNELKELNNGLKRYTESLDKKEKDIDKQYEGSLKTNDADMSRSNQTLSALTAQMAVAKTQGEKDNIQLAINKENANKASIISARTSIESAKTADKAAAKTQVENDTGVNKDTHKAQIKALEDRETQLSKDITNTKLGEEKEVPDLDSHGNPKLDANGNPKMKKIRIGGIAGIEQSISKVKNDRMLKATLDYKRKKTGDATKTVTVQQHFEKIYGADAEKKGQEIYKDSWDQMKNVTHAGFTVTKDGNGHEHEHEVTHLVDNHFHPESYKSNYKVPAGGSPAGGGGGGDHGHDNHAGGHDDHGHH